MRVVLLNSSRVSQSKDQMQLSGPHLRIGVASIASFLRENGVSVAVFDPYAEKMGLNDIAEKVVSFAPDFLGLSSYTEEINDAARIAGEVKRLKPDVVTVVGGCHVSAIPVDTLKEFEAFDIGVVGEGERTLLEIVKGGNPGDIKGVVYRGGSGDILCTPPADNIDRLDTLPFPAWDLYDLKSYGDMLPVEAVRGCPFSCVFCFRSVGRKVRYKSPQRMVEEVKRNIRDFGVANYAFDSGGTFPLNKEHAIEFCNLLIDNEIGIKWRASTRVTIIEEDMLVIMKKSGCRELSLGIESGDPEILKNCSKGTTPEDAEKALKLCKKAGIKTELNFIIGLPGETMDSIGRTRKFALKVRKYAERTNFAILTPFPGTGIYDMAKAQKAGFYLLSTDWDDYCKQKGTTLGQKNFETGELVKIQSRLYLRYYLMSPIQMLKIFSFGRAFQLIKRLIKKQDRP